jgi:hypothetical protein
LKPARVFRNPGRVRRIHVGSRRQFQANNRAIMLRPAIDRVFGPPRTRRAFAWSEARAHIGEVVISGD